MLLLLLGRRSYGMIVLHVKIYKLQSRIFDLTSHFQDGIHSVISHRKVLSSGECTLHSSIRQMSANSSVYSTVSVLLLFLLFSFFFLLLQFPIGLIAHSYL